MVENVLKTSCIGLSKPLFLSADEVEVGPFFLQFAHNFCCFVGRVVVDDENVELPLR